MGCPWELDCVRRGLVFMHSRGWGEPPSPFSIACNLIWPPLLLFLFDWGAWTAHTAHFCPDSFPSDTQANSFPISSLVTTQKPLPLWLRPEVGHLSLCFPLFRFWRTSLWGMSYLVYVLCVRDTWRTSPGYQLFLAGFVDRFFAVTWGYLVRRTQALFERAWDTLNLQSEIFRTMTMIINRNLLSRAFRFRLT